MNLKKLAKDIFFAVGAQGASMLLSIVTSFILPKFLGVAEFDYWQLFVFYVAYSGFFHLGICDGLYLTEGGKRLESLDAGAVKSEFVFSAIYQGIFAVIIFCIAFLPGFERERTIVLSMAAIYMVVYNCSLFLGFILQACGMIASYCVSVVIDRVLFIVLTIILILIGANTFVPYIVAYTISKISSLVFCGLKTKNIICANWLGLKDASRLSLRSIKIGINLMIANVASQLVVGVARFVLDIGWGIETFGQVSLTLSLVNFILAFSTQVGMVIFPALRQSSESTSGAFFSLCKSAYVLIAIGAYLLYFPVSYFMNIWLPDYSVGLSYLALVLPICVFDGRMNLCSSTLFKTLRFERDLLLVNAFSFILSLVFSVICGLWMHNVDLLLVGMVIAIFLRNLISEIVLSRRLKSSLRAGDNVDLVLTVVFVAAVYCLDFFSALAVVMVTSVLIVAFRYKAIASDLKLFLN